jgi:hypothetical protein
VNPFLLDRLEAEGTTAMLPGVLELTQWDQFRPLMAGRSVPLLLSNIYVREGEERRPVAERRLVATVNDVRIGLIGVMDRKVFAKVKAPAGIAFEIDDPEATIAELAPSLRETCDLVAVMACMDDRDALDLAGKLEGIDLVLGGYQSVPSDRPLLSGRVIVSRSGMRGQVLNTTRLIVSPSGQIVDWFGYNYPLTADYPDDPAVDSLVADVSRRAELAQARGIQAEMLGEEVAAGAAQGGEEGAPVAVVRYVGAAACGSCHGPQYRQWSQTAHARAFETVAGALEGDKVARYVTGYGEPSGFRSDRETPDLRGVQCEVCHGPASSHARGAAAHPVTEETCRRCHTVADGAKWNFREALAAVRH